MKLLLADDQSLLRDALSQLLLMQDEISEVVALSNGQEVIDYLGTHTVDVVILDVEMPEKSGLDALEWIRSQGLACKVIIVTTFKRKGYFARAVEAQVDGYVLKDRNSSELMDTIHQVLSGTKVYSPELMEDIVVNHNILTEQELQILTEISLGCSNQQIADKLYLSNGTVRNYVSIILSKLNAENRTEAVRIARDNEWL